jgi:hypothetical protein
MTDPFHDAKIYASAPLYLMRGQLIDPMDHARDDDDGDSDPALVSVRVRD